MVKRTLGLILAALMLMPACAFAAPSTADLARQIEMLTQQLTVLQEQVAEVQDSADSNADSVELLEESSEKWDEASRFEFFGDYRFRMDYSETDTPEYWGAGAIAGAVADMSNVMTAVNGIMPEGTPAEYMMPTSAQGLVGFMNSFSPEMRNGMIQDLQNQLTGMVGDAAYAPTVAAALAKIGTYTPTPANTYKNDILYTNRFRLGMKAKVSENMTFKGRLAMYKAWGMQSNPTDVGPYSMNNYAAGMDGATTRHPGDSVLRVDRAYVNWTGVADLPMWISVGRRPTTDGPPAHLRQNTKRMATPTNFMDYAFDGATIGAVFDNPFDFMGYSKIRFCYGRGFEAGPTNNDNDTANELDDMDFGGLNWDMINKGDRLLNVQAFAALNIVNVADGVNFANPLELAMGTGNGMLDTENLGDIYHTSFVYMDKYADLNYFVAGGWSRTDPDGVDEMGSTLLGSWWENPGQKDGYIGYVGVRYDMEDLGLKVGLEYNYGTKNWISMTPAYDDMTQAKLATRGHVGEIYLIWDLPVGELLSDKCDAFMRLGYQHYEYEYTGSGSWLGAPADIDELDDPLNAQFWAPIDKMDQVYFTMEAYF
ncbi:MAG: DUF3373 family protein [Deltaproteobacteria bacterium]|nr:DUF3373 family protein [Deltaproteobacteria bacterium]